MAKKKTAEADTSFNPGEFDPAVKAAEIVQEVAAAMQMPEGNGHANGQEQAAQQPAANGNGQEHGNGHAAKVKRAELPDKMTIRAGDLKVQFIDKGSNAAGVGIRVVAPEGRELTAEEKDIIREVMKAPTQNGRSSAYRWQGSMGMWHAEIGRDADATKAVAVRLDGESRTQALADKLKHLQADPVGYREMIQQQRGEAQEGQSR